MPIMLPPLDVDPQKVTAVTAVPKDGYDVEPATGIRLTSQTSGNWTVVRDAFDRYYLNEEIDQYYTIKEEGDRDITDLVTLLKLPVVEALEPEQAISVALALLVSARWKAADDFSHDSLNQVTFLINALSDPEKFVREHAMTNNTSDQEDKESENQDIIHQADDDSEDNEQ